VKKCLQKQNQITVNRKKETNPQPQKAITTQRFAWFDLNQPSILLFRSDPVGAESHRIGCHVVSSPEITFRTTTRSPW
jgi:hypothetical protein